MDEIKTIDNDKVCFYRDDLIFVFTIEYRPADTNEVYGFINDDILFFVNAFRNKDGVAVLGNYQCRFYGRILLPVKPVLF